MRTLLLLGWLMVPVLFGAYHYGPGQEKLRLDDAARVLAEADRLATAQDWPVAAARRIRLKRAQAQMLARQLPEAEAGLDTLVDELQGDKAADPKLLAEAR